jgi:hypothetical protein
LVNYLLQESVDGKAHVLVYVHGCVPRYYRALAGLCVSKGGNGVGWTGAMAGARRGGLVGMVGRAGQATHCGCVAGRELKAPGGYGAPLEVEPR